MKISELAKLINADYLHEYDDIKVSSFKTNTKELSKNDVFIAINKGHEYLKDIKKCKAIITEIDFKSTKIPVLKVADTKIALKKIASYKRIDYRGTIIAITGSNGKTTTKELLGHILSTKYSVFKSYKNMNNDLGVPLNILELNNSKIAVFELGMNHKGEISELSKLLKPDIGIITNIGTAHIGKLGSKEKIYEAKMEILDGMPIKRLFVNGNDEYLNKNKTAIKVKWENELFQIKNIKESSEYLAFDLIVDKTYHIKYSIPSLNHLNNVALAIYISLYLGVKPSKIAKALNKFKAVENRMQIIKKKDKIIIDDSYNSNYESLISGISSLKNYSLNKICIIGSILELGNKEKEIYNKISSNLPNCYEYIFVGNKIKAQNAVYLDDVNDLISYYYTNKEKFRNKVIYIKGSHSVNLLKFVNELIR